LQQREEIRCAYRILDCKSEVNRLLGDKSGRIILKRISNKFVMHIWTEFMPFWIGLASRLIRTPTNSGLPERSGLVSRISTTLSVCQTGFAAWSWCNIPH
jgi:hypothetical protein